MIRRNFLKTAIAAVLAPKLNIDPFTKIYLKYGEPVFVDGMKFELSKNKKSCACHMENNSVWIPLSDKRHQYSKEEFISHIHENRDMYKGKLYEIFGEDGLSNLLGM